MQSSAVSHQNREPGTEKLKAGFKPKDPKAPMKNKPPGFATTAIHVGQEPDPETGAVIRPIYPTSTYVQQELGKNKGYEYARVSNPTRTRLEENLAALEGGSRVTRLCQRHGGHQCHLHHVQVGRPRCLRQ